MRQSPGTAFFPLSPRGKRLTSRTARAMAEALPEGLNHALVLVADELDRYNTAIHEVLNKGIQEETTSEVSFQDAAILIDSLHSRVTVHSVRMADAEDSLFADALRELVVSYHTNQRFRKDVVSTALSYVARKGWSRNPIIVELSSMYVLEELALNMRIRVEGSIAHEFYFGDTILPLLRLYEGTYGMHPAELLGLPKPDIEFDFYEWVEEPSPRWKKADSEP
jgi:hypothetical protein